MGSLPRRLDKKGKLSRAQLLRCRVRYFTDGLVIGSKEFIDDFCERNREAFGERGFRRPCEMSGGDWRGMRAFRGFRNV